MNMRTPVAFYVPAKSLPEPLTQMVPASVLSVPAQQHVPPKPHQGRALIGMEFGMPGARFRGLCKPQDDVEIYSFNEELDLDLSNITINQVQGSIRDAFSLVHSVADKVRAMGMNGVIIFDYMKEEPPFGLGFLGHSGLPVYSAFFKNPHDDWLSAFVPSKPQPYDSLTMRSNIARYAIEHPEMFDFKELKVSDRY